MENSVEAIAVMVEEEKAMIEMVNKRRNKK